MRRLIVANSMIALLNDVTESVVVTVKAGSGISSSINAKLEGSNPINRNLIESTGLVI